jgi:hypothetical protein
MRNYNRNRDNGQARMAVGVVVVIVGFLLLLDNLGWLDFDVSLHFWPAAIIFVGMLKILQTRSLPGAVIGGCLMLFGSLMLLGELGWLHVGWHTLWPLMLIAVGLSVVFRSVTGHRVLDMRPPMAERSGDDSVINVTAIMGGYVRRITSLDFRGGEITALMGGCELDLRQCSINGEAVLNVFVMFGGVQIRVPPDWTVVMHGMPIMGGFDEKTATPPDASKRLIITGSVILGGMDVRN